MNKFLTTIILGIGVAIAPAYADILCANTTDCTLHFTQGNSSSGFGPGDFGTVELALNTTTHVVTVTVILANGLLIGTGFPGTFGFNDSLGGGLTIGGFNDSHYSGFISDATSDNHFDGFGFYNNVAATTAPSAGSSTAVSSVVFTVSKGASITNVNQLLNLCSPACGEGPAYFVADIANASNTSQTGLIAVTGPNSVPDGGMTLMLLGGALVGLEGLRRRFRV